VVGESFGTMETIGDQSGTKCVTSVCPRVLPGVGVVASSWICVGEVEPSETGDTVGVGRSFSETTAVVDC
jgi:hypothetical protein